MEGYSEISPGAWKTGPVSLLANDKLLLTVKRNETDFNMMTVGWGGFGVMWGAPCMFFGIRPERYTYEFAETGNVVTLAHFPAEKKKILAYCGSHSGKDGDKAQKAGLHPVGLEGGGIGYAEADLILAGRIVCSVPLSRENFRDEGTVASWYQKEGYHKLYFAVLEKIYQKE